MAYSHGSPIPFVSYATPVPPPPGHACVQVSIGHGPYLISVAKTSKLKVDGRDVSSGGGELQYVLLPAGPHELKVTDIFGFPLMSSVLAVQPGVAHQLSFQPGGLRNHVYDGQGADVTKFGMLSNYAMLGIVLAVLLVICCGGVGLVSLLSAGSN